MFWFIVWMLLTADEPSRDAGMNVDERDYIIACLTSQSRHQQVRVCLRVCLCVSVCVCIFTTRTHHV